MFESTRRNVSIVSAGAVLTFCLATGAAVGVVPKIGDATQVAHARAESPSITDPGTGDAPEAPPTTPPPTAPPATTAPVSTPTPTTPRATARRTAPTASAPTAATPAPGTAAAAPAASTKAPRLTPTSAQVKAAIAALHAMIPLVTPTEAQAREFGNSVCDSFDAGQSFAQLKASAMQAARQIPFANITPAAVDTAVRTAVSLFCPGYTSKLV